jgi:hypothetical protein
LQEEEEKLQKPKQFAKKFRTQTDRQKETLNPEQRFFRIGRMYGALGGWSGLQVLVEKRRRSGNNKTICQELPDPDGQIVGKKEKNPKP